jgi:hypothetical protein
MARELGYKEDLSKGKMLRFEDSLPRLPVPTLEGNKDEPQDTEQQG